ncbi:MAG: LacI family DNA-binding transcriptional regulator [Bacillus sp. (in: firmicutes)]
MKEKKITIKDVATRANVSKATVSYVLNDVDKVSEATKKRVMKAIEELGYIPNSTARDLAKRTKQLMDEDSEHPFYQEFMRSYIQNKVGEIPNDTRGKLRRIISEQGYLPSDVLDRLIVPQKHTIAVFMQMERDLKHQLSDQNPFYQEFISGIEHTVQENGLSMHVYNSLDQAAWQDIQMDQVFVGIIVLGSVPPYLSKILKALNIPVVIVDEYGEEPNFITLTSEDKKGTFDSIEYLILKGHKKIAFVGCKLEKGNFINQRLDGYKEALAAYGYEYHDKYVYLSDVNYSYEEGIRIANKIADDSIVYDAVFCTADIMAIGLMKGFIKRGYKVPEDISIMGFDDIQFSKYSNPELTTVNQNIFLKAETAVIIILRKAEGEAVKHTYTFPLSIVERESVSNRNEKKE